MRNKLVLFLLLSIVALTTITVSAQDGKKQKLQLAIGVAKVVGDQKIVLQTKSGMLDAVLLTTTKYFRLPPDNIKLSVATDSQLSEISATDRVLVTGTYSKDKTSFFAVKVYLVKGSDIEAQQRKRQQDWQQRGISGRVKTIDATTKIITVEMRGITGAATTLQLSPKEEIKYLRYSPESVKYNDAVKSDISTIQKDDMIQALGDKSTDGKSFKAEEVLTGSFVTVAGTVKSVDAEKNEVTIKDLKTKKDVIISVKDTSLLKKFPPQAAQRMVRQMMRQRMGGGTRPPNSGNNSGEKSAEAGKGNNARRGNRAGRRNGRNGNGAGRRGGRGRLDINQMLNSFPTISVADLKAGEMIAVSSPKGADPSRLVAIKLLSGVEPFIQMAAATGGSRGRSGRRGSGGLRIPGLDGVQF